MDDIACFFPFETFQSYNGFMFGVKFIKTQALHWTAFVYPFILEWNNYFSNNLYY